MIFLLKVLCRVAIANFDFFILEAFRYERQINTLDLWGEITLEIHFKIIVE